MMPTRQWMAEAFARVLVELACEVFPAHGITEMPDEEWDELLLGISREAFDATVMDLMIEYGARKRQDEFLTRILRRGGKI